MRSPKTKTILRSQKLIPTLASVLALALVATSSLVFHQRHKTVIQRINYSQLYEIAGSLSAASLSIDGETLTVQRNDGSLLQATVTSEAAQQGVVEAFRKNNVPIEFRTLQAAPGHRVD